MATSTVQAASTPILIDPPDPFDLEPAILRPAASNAVRLRVLLLAVPIGLLTLIALSMAEGHLTSPGTPLSAAPADAWSLVTNAKAETDPRMPLARDFFSLVAAAIALGTYGFVYTHWKYYRAFFLTLFDRSLFYFEDPQQQQRFDVRLSRMRDGFRRSGDFAAIRMALAFVLSLGLMRAVRSTGIFGVLYPGNDSELSAEQWRHTLYDNWWLNFDEATLSTMAFTTITALFLYVLLLHNELNARMVPLFVSMRSSYCCGFDLDRADDDFGWKPLRRMMDYAVAVLILDGILLSYLLLLAPRTLVGWLAPMSALYLISVLGFGLLPHFLFTVGRRRAKRVERSRTLNKIQSAVQLAERGYWELQMQRVDAVSNWIFPGRYLMMWFVPVGAFAIISNMITVIQAVGG